MKKIYQYLVYSLVIILLLANAGCIAPPKETPAVPVGSSHQTQLAPKTNNSNTSSSFVTEVTLADYALSTTTSSESSGYTTFLPPTQIPADITCRIYSKSAAYSYNGSAFTFDQKNPPMFINYTVVPRNITKNDVYFEKTGTYAPSATEGIPGSGKGSAKTVTYTDYSPSSWFEVTVRDNTTKEIILQDGFGETKGYSTYLSRTLKILKSGDLLVEFRGNDIKASATIWVKPIGNFNESRLSEFTDCMYWEGRRDTVAIPVTILGVEKQGTQIPRNESEYQFG
jgi:hypothetical protein